MDPATTDEIEPRQNRRRFLRLAGAATAAGAAGAVALGAGQAEASTGASMLIGASNLPTANTDTTALVNPSTTSLMAATMRVANYSSTAHAQPGNTRLGVFAYVNGVDTSDGAHNAVYGYAGSSTGVGNTGVYGGAGNGITYPWNSASINIGVGGNSDGYGVIGQSSGTNGTGIGVFGYAPSSLDLFAGGSGRIYMVAAVASGPPTTGGHFRGEIVRDATSDVYVCLEDGTPGKWRKLAATAPTYESAGGSVNYLSKPIRLFDSRKIDPNVPLGSGSKLAPNTPVTVQVTGTTAQGLAVPTLAKGVIGNLTVVQPDGNGWLTVWPEGPTPSTSNLNYSLGNGSPAIANSFSCRLSAVGEMQVMTAGPSAAHVIIDIVGFIA